MTRLGRQDGEPLVVDLRETQIDSKSEFWEAIAVPCGLPDWFGRNLDAWADTLYGGISDVLDDHPLLILWVSARGMFTSGNADGEAVVEVTEDSGVAHVEVFPE